MKRILCVLFDLLTLAFLIGSYAFHYFAKRKLGMVRWLNYTNMNLQEQMPLDILKYVAVVAIGVLAVIVMIGYLKKRTRLGKVDGIMMIFMLILVCVYAGFTVFESAEKLRAYYFMMPFLGMAVFMQVLRNGMVLIWCRKK